MTEEGFFFMQQTIEMVLHSFLSVKQMIFKSNQVSLKSERIEHSRKSYHIVLVYNKLS